eukprot:gene4257-7593_t
MSRSITPRSDRNSSNSKTEDFDEDESTYSDEGLSRSNSMLSSPQHFLIKTPLSSSKRNVFHTPKTLNYESDSDEELEKPSIDVKKLEKKVQILKQFLLDERKLRKEEVLKTAKSLAQFDSLKRINKERKILTRKYELENNSLKERIEELEKYIKINEKTEEQPSKSFFGNLFGNKEQTSINIENTEISIKQLPRNKLEERCERLEREIEFYEDKITTLDEKLICSEKVIVDVKTMYKISNEQLNQYKDESFEKEDRLIILDEENKRLNNLFEEIKDEQRKEILETKLWKQRYEELSNEMNDQKNVLDQKEKEIVDLKLLVEQKEFTAKSMADKLVSMRSQLDSMNLKPKSFILKSSNPILSKIQSKIELNLKKNEKNENLELEFVTNGKKEIIEISSIIDIYPEDGNNIFTIELSDSNILTYECSDCDELIQCVKDYIRIQLQKDQWWNK